MRTTGKVIKVNGNKALISVERTTSCGGSCANCAGNCKIADNSIEADNTLGAKTGEFVVIETETKSVLKSAFLVYIVPIVLLCLGYFAAECAGYKENISMICGFLLFLLTFLCLHFYDKKQRKELSTKIVEIVR